MSSKAKQQAGKQGGKVLFKAKEPVKNDPQEAAKVQEIIQTTRFPQTSETIGEAAKEAQARIQDLVVEAERRQTDEVVMASDVVDGADPISNAEPQAVEPTIVTTVEAPALTASAVPVATSQTITVQIDASKAIEQLKEAAIEKTGPTCWIPATGDNHRVLRVKKLHEDAKLPTVAHPGEDLGYDLYAVETVFLKPNSVTMIPTGIAAHQEGHGLLLMDRSSMAGKGLFVVGGVIDAGFRGDLSVKMASSRFDTYTVQKGDKIAQAVPFPVLTGAVEEVEELPEASRGVNGFGSSGR